LVIDRKVDLAEEVQDNLSGVARRVLETHIEYHRRASGLRYCIKVRVYFNEVVSVVRRVARVNGQGW